MEKTSQDLTFKILKFDSSLTQEALRSEQQEKTSPCSYPTANLSNLKIDPENASKIKDLEPTSFEPDSKGLLDKTDRRLPVNDNKNPAKNVQFPFSAILSLEIFYENGEYSCGTGFMISNRFLLTAAQLLYHKSAKAKTIYASPGRDQDKFPFGIHKASQVYQFEESSESNSLNEMALLTLENDVGDFTGWFGLADMPLEALKSQKQQQQPENMNLNITGFENPKRDQNSYKFLSQFLVTHSGPLLEKRDILAYDIDAVQG